jgi:hypothetical protein
MRKLALLLTAAILSVSAATIASDTSTPEVIVIDRIKEKKPAVTFQHWKHQDRAGQKCEVCHHTRKGEERPQACSECHGKKENAPDFKKAMHTTCRECHKTKKAEGLNPPTKCSGCHPKE